MKYDKSQFIAIVHNAQNEGLNMQSIYKLSNGLYVYHGTVYKDLNKLIEYIKNHWKDDSIQIIEAEPRTNAYWMNHLKYSK